MASPVPCCLLCGAALPESKGRRSILSNEGNNVKQVVEDYVRKALSNGRLTASDIEVDDLSIAFLRRSTVLCKINCYNSVIRLLEKAKSFQELSNKLENELCKSLNAFMLDSGLPVVDTALQSPSVQRKRPHCSNTDWTPSRKRFRKESMNTPTRLFVANTAVAEDKSAVAVSSYTFYIRKLKYRIICCMHKSVEVIKVILIYAGYPKMCM